MMKKAIVLAGSRGIGKAIADALAESDLEVVVVQATEESPARLADFFTSHLRPSVGTRFHVFTPAEFERSAQRHPLLRETLALSPSIDA